MHDGARNFVRQCVEHFDLTEAQVLDLGGRAVNGSVHDFFELPVFVVDIEPGFGVDVVADAADWVPPAPFDVVLINEVAEHTPRWRDIIATAHASLKTGGVMILTCARDDRPAHSGLDGGRLRPGEYYQNVGEVEMREALVAGGWSQFQVNEADGYFGNDDLYVWAVK